MNYPGMDYLVETINKQAIVGGVIAPGMIGALAGNMLSWKINKNKGPSWHTKPLTYGLGAAGALALPAIMLAAILSNKNSNDYGPSPALNNGSGFPIPDFRKPSYSDVLRDNVMRSNIESNMNIGEELDYE